MARSRYRALVVAATVLCTVAFTAVTAPRATAQSFTDVPKTYWAYSAITSITDRSAGGQYLMDDYGTTFEPNTPLTRELLARALVVASGHYGALVTPVAINDVAASDPYYNVIQVALHLRYMGLDKSGDFDPTASVTARGAETSIVHWLKGLYPSADWSLLSTLNPSRWEPNSGWTTGAPSYLPYIVASRQLQLRYNHPAGADGLEVTPNQPIDRAEVAYMLWRGFQARNEYGLWGLADYQNVTFPPLSNRQKQIVSFALKYVGYPYVWGGEYPTKNSPYGHQAAGGFDCSGLVFYIMKMHFGYGLTVNERGAHDMAAGAKPRITRQNLKCGDLIFFGPKGPKSSVISIYHAALYLGNGWFIQSTGSTDGVTISSLDTSSYYKTYFAWGRRLLKPSELVVSPQTPAS